VNRRGGDLLNPGLTSILKRLGTSEDAWAELIPLVYSELRTIAAAYLRNEDPTATLQPTVLVHEAFLRLRQQHSISWNDRHHFYGVAAHLMRLMVVDHARRVRARQRLAPEAAMPHMREFAFYDALDQALERLAAIDERQARVVELRFFAGLDVEDTAAVLHVSPKTVKRDWSMARSWLHAELKSDERRKLAAG